MVGGGAKHMLSQGLEATGGCTPETFRPLYKRMLRHSGRFVSLHTAVPEAAEQTHCTRSHFCRRALSRAARRITFTHPPYRGRAPNW